jgi:hypothetical protein
MEKSAQESGVEKQKPKYGEKVRGELDRITHDIAKKHGVTLEGLTFGSFVREWREPHDMDFRVLAPDERMATLAADEFEAALKARKAAKVKREFTEEYGGCWRVTGVLTVQNETMPVEIFFADEKNKTGMFSGRKNENIMNRRHKVLAADPLPRISRAQDARNLIISILRELERDKPQKIPQRYDDLLRQMNQHTRRAVGKMLAGNDRSGLYEWLGGENDDAVKLVQRNKDRINELLETLHANYPAPGEDEHAELHEDERRAA